MTARSQDAGRRRWLVAALIAAALVPLSLKIPAAVAFTVDILGYPFQVDDSEGVILSEAQWLARGVDPYQPVRPDFFTAAPYTPLYTALNAAAFALGPFTFKVGRGLALLATLAVGIGVGGMVWWRIRSQLLGLWAALALLTLNLVSVWSVRARPDHLALAFNLAGFAIIWIADCRVPARGYRIADSGTLDTDRGGSRPTPHRIIHIPQSAIRNPQFLAAILFALGFYTKQTLLAAPLAVGLYLLLRRPRVGLAFGALYGALVLLPFALLTLVTRGGFYQHIVAFHSSWSSGDFLFLARPFLARHWPLLLIGVTLAVLALSRGALGVVRRRSPAGAAADPDLLPALYAVTAAAGALGAGTHGGNHNHFVETLVVAVLCAGLLSGRLLRSGRTARVVAGAVLLMTLSTALLLEARLDTAPDGVNWLARDFRRPRAAERAGWAQLAAYVTNDPGPVYSDNVGLLLVAGKEVRYTDPFSLTYAARTGQWDQAALVERVERGEFSLIALRYDIFVAGGAPTDLTPELFQAIRARYRVVERNVMYLYVPR